MKELKEQDQAEQKVQPVKENNILEEPLIPHGALLAFTSFKYKTIEQVLKPRVIDQQKFVHLYAEEDVKSFLNYITCLDTESIVAFVALIDFMNAGVKINSEYPVRNDENYDELELHSFNPVFGGEKLVEYRIYASPGIDSFIMDYRHGDIVLSFDAGDLLDYLSVMAMTE